MKTCTGCGEEKEDSNFFMQKNGKLETRCKKCRGERQRDRLKEQRSSIDEKFYEEKLKNAPINKKCSVCSKQKSIECFEIAKRNKDGFASQCNPCRKDRRKIDKFRTTNRNRHLVNTYNITLEEYNYLLKQQNEVCFICLNKCSTNNILSVDHDHETGEVRGLLCHRHNAAIGLMNESIELVEKTLDYLRNPPARTMLHLNKQEIKEQQIGQA